MAATTAAARTWDELNERQQQWLLVIYRADQEAEKAAKSAWHEGRRSPPASVWRWLEYGETGGRGRSAPSGQVQHALHSRKLWDQGAGSTMEVLRARGLIETRGESLPMGGTMLYIKLTKRGRAAARAGGADDAAGARRKPAGLLSETLWSMLTDAVRAGDDGLRRSYATGGWSALADRDPGLVTVTTGSSHDRITITSAGLEHYHTHWRDYAQLYPAVAAPNPDADSGPHWPGDVDTYLGQLATTVRTIGGQLRQVRDELGDVAEQPAEQPDPTPEQAAARELAEQRRNLEHQRQNLLTRHRDELHQLYRNAVARYAATACAVVTATADGHNPQTVLDQPRAELDERGRGPHLPCPTTGLPGVDREIATTHRTATTGATAPRRQRDRQHETRTQPAGRDVAAVHDYAAHLHQLAANGQLQRLLLRRDQG